MFRTLALAALSAGALTMPIAASAAPKGCPPGLAKKQNGCNPPGHVKGYTDRDDDDYRYRYRTGDRIDGDVIILRNPDRYGLPNGTYYRNDDVVYRVDPETRKVLNVIGAIAALAD
ncbi:excinuclease ABC subunit A [Salipiger sp.]|uniref:excinuclease ABC subunit A n=1 Tax=Salipiger sp. TaxID=2078585 RepID=UPI003A97A030